MAGENALDNTYNIRANFESKAEEVWQQERPYGNYFKIGKQVPFSDVNISYFETPAISADNINIINLFDETPHATQDFDIYVPDENNVLNSWPLKERAYIDTSDFIITNLSTDSENIDGKPLYYKYKLKYLHNHVAKNIYDEISVINRAGQKLSADSAAFEIKDETIFADNDEEEEHNIKEVTLKLSETFEQDLFYVSYSPIYNPKNGEMVDMPDDYRETINPEPLFEEVSHERFQNIAALNRRVYSKRKSAGDLFGYNFGRTHQIRVPHSAVKDEDLGTGRQEATLSITPTEDKDIKANFEYAEVEDEYNIKYQSPDAELFDYRVYASGNVTGDGLLCYILYEHSKNLKQSSGDENRFELLNEEIIEAMNEMEESVEGEALFNVLYYTTLAAYDNEFVADEIEGHSMHLKDSPGKKAHASLHDTDIIIGESKAWHTASDFIGGANLFIWEGGDSKFYSKDKLIENGKKSDGLWGGDTANALQNHANNMCSAYRYALDNMTYFRNTEENKFKDAAIVTVTSSADNASSDYDVDFVTSGEAADTATDNNIISFGLGWSGFGENIDNLKSLATDNDEFVFKDDSVENLFESVTEQVISEEKTLSEVYLPLYPSGNSYYKNDIKELPWATGWVKDEERIVVDSIKYPEDRLNDVSIHLDSKYDTGNKLDDLGETNSSTPQSISQATENMGIAERLVEKHDVDDIDNINLSDTDEVIIGEEQCFITTSDRLIGDVECWVTEPDRIIGDPVCIQTAEERCIESIGFMVNDRDKYWDWYDAKRHEGTVTLSSDEITPRDKISVIVDGNCTVDLNTRKYFVKKDRRKNRVDIKLEQEGQYQRWYLKVHNSSFTNTVKRREPRSENGYNSIRTVYVISPEHHEGAADSISQAKEKPENITDKSIDLENDNLYIDSMQTAPGEDNNLIIPDEEYINLSTDNKVIDWSESEGRIELENPPSEDLEIEYKYQDWWRDYKGFYFQNKAGKMQFVPLDLNPRRGHISGRMTNHGIEYIRGSELAGEVIYLYVRPYYIQRKERGQYADVPGTRRGNVLFHTIGKELDSLNYPLFDRIERNLVQLDDMVLLSKIYVQPESDVEEMTYIDTRTRGGGAFPDKLDDLKEEFPEVNYYWDVGNWNGKPYPSNAVIVIEIPEEVKDYLTEDEIEHKIEKHLALGVVPIIRYV